MKVDSGGVGGKRSARSSTSFAGEIVSLLCELTFAERLNGFCGTATGVTSEVGDPDPAAGLAKMGDKVGLFPEAGTGGAGARFLLAAMSRSEGVDEGTSFFGGGCSGSSFERSRERKKGLPEECTRLGSMSTNGDVCRGPIDRNIRYANSLKRASIWPGLTWMKMWSRVNVEHVLACASCF